MCMLYGMYRWEYKVDFQNVYEPKWMQSSYRFCKSKSVTKIMLQYKHNWIDFKLHFGWYVLAVGF